VTQSARTRPGVAEKPSVRSNRTTAALFALLLSGAEAPGKSDQERSTIVLMRRVESMLRFQG